MKKQLTRTLCLRTGLLATFLSVFFSFSASAQFNPPVFFEDTYPNVGPNIGLTGHTSAYSVQHVATNLGPSSLVLAGWDDANLSQPAGVSWRLLQIGNPSIIINQGIIPYSNVRDLEVGYVKTTTDPQMLVAYYDVAAPGHKLDVYSLMSGTPVLLYTNVLSAMPNYTRISMDCHRQYAIAIAWEDVSGINTIFGLSWSGPAIQYSAPLTLNGTFGDGTVDVAFSHNSILNGQYVYYNPNTGNITESEFDFWTGIYIVAPTVVNPTVNDINPVGSCHPCDAVPGGIPVIQHCPYMNIDCPGHYNVDNFAYTYTTDNTNISVRLLDLNTSLVANTVVVNNGSALPSMPINSTSNVHPFCAYDVNCAGPSANINVAWHTSFIDPWIGTAAGYVGLRMNESGTVLLSPPDYLTVANNPTWASMTPVLSISKSDDINPLYMYTVFPEYDPTIPGFRMENKYPAFCSNSYKGNPDGENGTTIHACNDEKNIAEYNGLYSVTEVGVSPNPFNSTFSIDIPKDHMNDEVNIVVLDVLGGVIAQYDGPASGANSYFNTKTRSLASGSYFVNVNIGEKVKQTIKVTKVQ